MNNNTIDYGYGLKATKSFQDDSVTYVSGAIQALKEVSYREPFKIDFLYGDEWEEFSDYRHRLIGRIIASMVRKRGLKLDFTGSPKTKPRRYRVKYS